MSFSTPRGFVRRAPSKADPSRFVDIRITDMNARDALWWDRRLGPHHARNSGRADRRWAWSVLLPMCHLMQLAKRRFCRPLVIWARADNGQFVRAGMSILVEGYPHLDVSAPSDSYFVWFISAADSDVLKNHFGVSDPPTLGRILLDNPIILSQNTGFAGRIGLHAAVLGGPRLFAFYVKCGLLNVPATAAFPPSITRKNDGRFFYADAVVAEAMAAQLDAVR